MPDDQLMVQFQGMFPEYEKAEILGRYRRGKAYRAKTGSINVLSGAPSGYRYVRKNTHTGAAYEIVEHEAVLVTELFRRYADEPQRWPGPGRVSMARTPTPTCTSRRPRCCTR
jgi:site-specific DNA recombinase